MIVKMLRRIRCHCGSRYRQAVIALNAIAYMHQVSITLGTPTAYVAVVA